MAKGTINGSQALSPTALSRTDNGDHGSSPKLRGMDSNPQGAFGPRFWQAFRDTVTHIYDAVSLPAPHPPQPAPPRDPDALSGHGVHHDGRPRHGRARRRPAADPSPARGIG